LAHLLDLAGGEDPDLTHTSKQHTAHTKENGFHSNSTLIVARTIQRYSYKQG
jgi:hypothetical protein